MEAPTVTAPWTPNQIKLHTVAFGTRSINAGHTGKIVLYDASFKHLLISGTEVDDSKVISAGKTDAGKAGSGRNASSEQEHALVVLSARNVNRVCERPASLQH